MNVKKISISLDSQSPYTNGTVWLYTDLPNPRYAKDSGVLLEITLDIPHAEEWVKENFPGVPCSCYKTPVYHKCSGHWEFPE